MRRIDSLGLLIALVLLERGARDHSVPLLLAHAAHPLNDADEATVEAEALVDGEAVGALCRSNTETRAEEVRRRLCKATSEERTTTSLGARTGLRAVRRPK